MEFLPDIYIIFFLKFFSGILPFKKFFLEFLPDIYIIFFEIFSRYILPFKIFFWNFYQIYILFFFWNFFQVYYHLKNFFWNFYQILPFTKKIRAKWQFILFDYFHAIEAIFIKISKSIDKMNFKKIYFFWLFPCNWGDFYKNLEIDR